MANEYAVNKSDLTSVADAIRIKGETSEQLVFPADFVTAIQEIKGGAELNFEVVGGATEPSDPKENTIWVETETEIAGWAFSVEEPDSPEPGMVWINVSLSSIAAFNALKENGLQVYPLAVYQYIDDEWSFKPTRIFQSEEWVLLWQGELYTPGDEWEAITGGWAADGYSVIFSGTSGTVYTGTKTESYMQTDYESGWYYYMFGTQLPIDLADVDHIEFDVTRVSGDDLYVIASETMNFDITQTTPQVRIEKSGVVNLDVSGLSMAYISIIPYPIKSDPPVWRINNVRCVR